MTTAYIALQASSVAVRVAEQSDTFNTNIDNTLTTRVAITGVAKGWISNYRGKVRDNKSERREVTGGHTVGRCGIVVGIVIYF